MNPTRTLCCCVAMTAMLSIVLTGCTPGKAPPKSPTAAAKHPEKGPRGGSLAEWGDDEYHVEYTVDTASKSAVLYILKGALVNNEVVDGIQVDAKKITDMKLVISEPKLEIDMKYDPGRSEGKKVVFVGTDPAFGDAKAAAFKGEIGAKVDGKRFDGRFPLPAGH